MIRELQKLLRPIRSRLTLQGALPTLSGALMIGGWLALVAALLTLFGGSRTSGLIGIAVAIGFPVVAFTWKMLRPARWQAAARLADQRLQLHDRTATALHLAENEAGDPFAALQIDDALAQLRRAKPNEILLSLPWQRIASGVLLTAFSLALIAWGIIAPPTASIQTSGDMQDLRPEVVERVPVDLVPLSAEVIANSVRIGNEVLYDGLPRPSTD